MDISTINSNFGKLYSIVSKYLNFVASVECSFNVLSKKMVNESVKSRLIYKYNNIVIISDSHDEKITLDEYLKLFESDIVLYALVENLFNNIISYIEFNKIENPEYIDLEGFYNMYINNGFLENDKNEYQLYINNNIRK